MKTFNEEYVSHLVHTTRFLKIEQKGRTEILPYFGNISRGDFKFSPKFM